MIQLRNDYSSGAHPAVMEALLRTNLEQTIGYGLDGHCLAAADTIRGLCKAPEADVHFFVGGTQVNKTTISAFLRPYEAVIAVADAHICVHEAGSIEQDGHKVIHCAAPDAKLTPEIIRAAAASHSGEHMVTPRLAYISNSTELGTVYSREELHAVSRACAENGLLLYCDGARLGCAMTAPGAETELSDYAECCDAFTIGGTKNGLLFGEALVITAPSLKPFFRSCMKQQGAILAKGRLLGVQFSAILKDGLYLELARHSNRLAAELTEGLTALGVPLYVRSPSNQVFPILPNGAVEALRTQVEFELISPVDDRHTCVRFVTGWSSTREDVGALLEILKNLI